MFTENLISFSIIMLMLSFVTERVANFMKLYFQNKVISIFYPQFLLPKERRSNDEYYNHLFLKTKITILAFKQPSIGAEKEREQRILIINIILGVIIAALVNANFFQIVEQLSVAIDPESIIKGWDIEKIKQANISFRVFLLGALYLIALLWSISLLIFRRLHESTAKLGYWDTYTPFYIILVITLIILLFQDTAHIFSIATNIVHHSIGFIITGIFISLGSKFWHDLLDLLFLAKNVRQRLSEKETFTNYSSANQILGLAKTSQYEVAERLFEIYGPKISALEGVLSCGLYTEPDERSNLLRKIIEVEFNSSEAQQALHKIKEEGSVVIDHNTFYLKNYLKLLYSESLKALPSVAITEAIENTPPKCYAYNKSFPNNKGSFSIIQKEDKYYAISNLHVFASKQDFKKFAHTQNVNLIDRKVALVIGDQTFEADITDDYKFGTYQTYGYDYCSCLITDKGKEAYETYHKIIDQDRITPKDEKSIKMFGATSKYVSFFPRRHITYCKVDFGDFKKEMYLLKVAPSNKDVNFGDSGALVSFRIPSTGDNTRLIKGMLVAKSKHYAYIFQIID